MSNYPSCLGVRGVIGIVLRKLGRAGHSLPACVDKDEIRIRWKPLDCFTLLGFVMYSLGGWDEGVVFSIKFFQDIKKMCEENAGLVF